MAQKSFPSRAALYERLSREDGDRLESDSIVNQQRLLEDYCARHPELQPVGHYPEKSVIAGIKAGSLHGARLF